MKRRLFFLLPNTQYAKQIVYELNQIGIDQSHMHVIARDDIDTTGLPASTSRQRKDSIYRIEQFLWNANLGVFTLALFFALYFFVTNSPLAALLSIAIMLTCFAAGCIFTMKVPSTHLSEFETAISHGEILLVVNTLKENVETLENYMHSRHPVVITAGIGWTLEALKL